MVKRANESGELRERGERGEFEALLPFVPFRRLKAPPSLLSFDLLSLLIALSGRFPCEFRVWLPASPASSFEMRITGKRRANGLWHLPVTIPRKE